MTDREKELAFMEELTALSKKYDIEIAGCGCCESPFFYHGPIAPEAKYVWNVRYPQLKLLAPGDMDWEANK